MQATEAIRKLLIDGNSFFLAAKLNLKMVKCYYLIILPNCFLLRHALPSYLKLRGPQTFYINANNGIEQNLDLKLC